MSDSQSNTNRKFFGLFTLRLLRSLISVVTLILSAEYFGVSRERDFWLISFNAIVVINLAVWGPINETFRTQFIFIREKEGDSISIYRTASIIIFTICISSLLVLSLLSFPTVYVDLIAPNKSPDDVQLLIFLIRVLAPSLLINQLTLLLSSILNAYNIFYIPEIAGFISSVLNILCLILLVPSIGIYALAVSYYLGLFILLLLLIYQIRKNNIALLKRPITFKIAYLKPYIIFALPFFFPYFFGQLNAIAEKSFASMMGNGTVSILDYSRKFIDIPSSVLISVLTTILVPILSQKYAQNNLTDFTKEFKNIFQLGLLLLGSLLAYFTLASLDVMDLFYKSKNISDESLIEISTISVYYCFSVIAMYMYTILGLALMSTGKGKIYAICGVTTQLVMLVINYTFYKKLGIYVFPTAWFFSHLIAAAIMICYLPFMMRSVIKSTISYGLFSLLFAVICYFLRSSFSFSQDQSAIFILIIKSAIFGILGITLVYLFRLEERLLITSSFREVKSRVLTTLRPNR